ncbi:MEDS domain-containing protein [Streptacidiphilus sp. P02-A3a]|uniref:MEDS domain-containing protein n=1 Tax=Streptacidiphilus sp. P02-A3a TaxID=2704468 RepID=UPI0015FCCE77|nr:MEDS domain-containing protein [Streptacidiphilus sp. P02-A3a]QMU70537.1 STAS domain-containing protein [Streptacidiphilus sp. P02-A3a]
MRSARTLPTLDPVEVGDHVCWLVDPGDDFTGTARAFLSDGALYGDKVLVVGARGPRRQRREAAPELLVDPHAEDTWPDSWDAEAMLGVVRREADTANREGFRALRVLARMDQVWPDGASPAEVARHELGLDALVAEGRALVVCAYHRQSFRRASVEQSVGVHPHTVGMRPVMPDFRMFSAESDCWSVSGVVDSDGAATFRTAVSGLLSRSATVRLRCEGLELMDAAGMQALAEAAAAFPDRKVIVEGANETVRRCWALLGYDAPQIPVELAP